jgi:sugar lactone lactonase YvrE
MAISIQDVEIVADGLDHPECVIYHPDGSLWAGGEAGQIYRISLQGKVEEVANTGGFILGMALSPGRDWLAICDLKKKCVWRLDLTSFELTCFATGATGHSFNIPNFICFDKNEDLYVSDSGAFRQVYGKILKFDKAGNGSIWCEGPFSFSNGMAIDSRYEFIYVVCTFAPSIERVPIKPDGSAGKREVFVTFHELVPDGVAFDEAGNLLVSCYAPNKIFIVSPDRAVHVLIEDWEAHTLCNPTNIAFGGEKFDALYVANLGRWHISRINLSVKGLPLACHH